jgi:hypothetical protein
MVLEDGRIRDYLDQLHHAAVFVREDVAVQDVLAGVVGEAAAHAKVAAVKR